MLYKMMELELLWELMWLVQLCKIMQLMHMCGMLNLVQLLHLQTPKIEMNGIWQYPVSSGPATNTGYLASTAICAAGRQLSYRLPLTTQISNTSSFPENVGKQTFSMKAAMSIFICVLSLSCIILFFADKLDMSGNCREGIQSSLIMHDDPNLPLVKRLTGDRYDIYILSPHLEEVQE